MGVHICPWCGTPIDFWALFLKYVKVVEEKKDFYLERLCPLELVIDRLHFLFENVFFHEWYGGFHPISTAKVHNHNAERRLWHK